MIDRTRVYQYEPRAIARANARRRAERLRRFILRAFFTLLIAAGLFALARSFVRADEDCPGVPNAPARCNIHVAPIVEYQVTINLPIAIR
jgi:hypothetical protein